MLGRTNTGGGSGGGGLNFKVICNPQPSTAKENTIWVDTDRINNHYFSATQPENMAEYDVWFSVGTSSPVEFSATKKNPIMVYPLSAKQYVSGTWVDKTAKSWQSGEWGSWVKFVFQNGAFTNGGFGKQLGESGSLVEIQGGELYIVANGRKTTRVWTENKYDITGKSKLVFVVSQMINANSGGKGTWHFGISRNQNDDSFVAETTVTALNDTAKKEYTVSLPPDGGIYYVKVTCVRTSYYRDEAFIQEIRLQ